MEDCEKEDEVAEATVELEAGLAAFSFTGLTEEMSILV